MEEPKRPRGRPRINVEPTNPANSIRPGQEGRGLASQKRRGRPASGKALTSSQRVQRADALLLAEGGRILNRVRLSPDAAKALAYLSEVYGSDRAACQASIIAKCRQLIEGTPD
jgi:hypothetical protein